MGKGGVGRAHCLRPLRGLAMGLGVADRDSQGCWLEEAWLFDVCV